PVYALAFHVDYWNYLGWKDIYSCKAYSLRQKKYAQKLNSYVYTPQMIIDGKYQFVGSDRSKAHHYIDKALNRKRDLQLSIDVKMNASNGNVNIDYSLDQLPENSVMHFALVERGLERDVKKGENRGRILHHDNVVRVFRTIQLMNKKGSRELPIPEDVDESMASIIVYTQKTDGKIVAAKGQDLL
ncbi:MAG TPA: DUF1223 domain-containing protein, partial [Balneolaceae bacterium]|nr:DUF1223 domain-containing protein [Balneolaceae bacterium]